MAPSEPVLEKPVPIPDTYEIIRNEFPGSVAKQPPIDFPAEPGLHVSVGWSSYIQTDFETGTTGVIRVRWGRNDGTLHGKKDYTPLKLLEPGKQMEASAGIDYIPGTSEGDVVVTVTEINTYGNTPRIVDRIEVPEGAEWAQLAAFYPAVMPAAEVNALKQWTIVYAQVPTAADPYTVVPYWESTSIGTRPVWDHVHDSSVITGSSALTGNHPIRPFDKLRFRWGIPDLGIESFVDYDPPTDPPAISGAASVVYTASVLRRFIAGSSFPDNQALAWLYEVEIRNASNVVLYRGEWHEDTRTWIERNLSGPPNSSERFWSGAVAAQGMYTEYKGWIALVEHINS